MASVLTRRPLKSRSAGWATAVAGRLTNSRITPNQISTASIAFAAAGAASLLLVPAPAGYLGAAACVQLRLACNLLDGMVAVEGGKRSPLGELYNEVPDRISDAILITALGYGAGLPALGWVGALAAVSTAYLRALGGAIGLQQDFRGPLAKPQRMAVMTIALLGAAAEPFFGTAPHCLVIGTAAIAIGALVTCLRRLRAMSSTLKEI